MTDPESNKEPRKKRKPERRKEYTWCQAREQWVHRALCVLQSHRMCSRCDESYLVLTFKVPRRKA